MQYSGAQEYERLTPLENTRLWSAFRAMAEDQTIVELRIIALRSADDVARLVRRLQLISVVRHPSIRQVIDIVPGDTDQDSPFFVVESFTGETLRVPWSHKSLTAGQTILLGMQIAGGLAEAHRCGVTAGKIFPDSIFERSADKWALDLTKSLIWEMEGAAPEADSEEDVLELCTLLKGLCNSKSSGSQSEEDCQWSDDDGTSKLTSGLLEILDRGIHSDPFPRPSAEEVFVALKKLDASLMEAASGDTDSTLVAPMQGADQLERTLYELESSTQPGVTPVPESLGRFKLHEKLGSGATGVVFRATDLSNGVTVAVKVLNPELARNPLALQRFSKEARMLMQTGNPYVASLLDSNYDQNLHFLAIEFVPGGTLSNLIRGGKRLSEKIALRLMVDAARGLAVAHHQSIFHRDVKPDNILITAEGRKFASRPVVPDEAPPDSTTPLLKLSDFGLARMDHQSDSLAITHAGTVLGTPLYMSPEQCRGQQTDARSDVYSLGATLFQMLAGRTPFKGDNCIAVMNAHCQDPLPSISKLCPEISEGCVSVVEKCLARNPDARYSDASALQADLERLLHGESTSMLRHPISPPTQGAAALEFQFECTLSASPSQLWPYISNTNHVNHALGLSSVTYTTRTDPARGVERFAEMRVAGQWLKWQEHPYEWIEGRRLSVLREFSKGPFLWYMNIVELLPSSGGGTTLVQRFRVVPKNWLGRTVAKLQFGRKLPKSFRSVYQQIDRFLQQSNTDASLDPWGTGIAMTSAGRSRLLERLRSLADQQIDPMVLETLGQFLQHASDLEVARIRPLVFAERFQLNPKHVIAACLLGAKEGLLVLLWDILCPSCRIPANIQETLAALKSHAWCPSCDLRYEVDFANSVELIFRAHPEVRASETKTYCIGGPAFSAHVVAQTRLMPGERFELDLNLNEGTYRLRSPQLPLVVDLRVSAGSGATRLELPLLRPPVAGSIPALRQGTQVVSLFNNCPREVLIRLERTAGREMALTASAAASIPLFREMFPQEVLAPGQIVSVASVTLLLAELVDASRLYEELGDGPAFGQIRHGLLQLEERIQAAGGAVVKIVAESVVATFSNSLSALQAAAAILKQSSSESLLPRLALHRGSAMVTTINDRLDYFGETVHLTRAMLQSAMPRELLATARTLQQDDLIAYLVEQGLSQHTADFTLDSAGTILCRVRPVARQGPFEE